MNVNILLEPRIIYLPSNHPNWKGDRGKSNEFNKRTSKRLNKIYFTKDKNTLEDKH